MAEAEDFLDFLLGVTNAANNAVNSQLQYAEADAARLQKEKLIARADFETEKKDTVTRNLAHLKDSNTQVEREIQNTVNDGLKYGVSLNEYIKEEFQTDEYKELMENYGVNINDRLMTSLDIFEGTQNAVGAHKDMLDVNNIILNKLDGMIQDFARVEDARKYLGKELGDSDIYDNADIEKFIADVSTGMYSPNIIANETILEGLDPSLINNEGEVPYANYEDLPPEKKDQYKKIFGGSFTTSEKGPTGEVKYKTINTEDILESTFFSENPWAKDYVRDPSFIHGTDTRALAKVQSANLNLKSKVYDSNQDVLKSALDFKSWDENARIMNAGHDNIKIYDDASDEKGSANVPLNRKMGITPNSSKLLNYTDNQAKNPKVMADYKHKVAKEALLGIDYFTQPAFSDEGNVFGVDKDGAPSIEKYSPNLGKLRREYVDLNTKNLSPEQLINERKSIEVAMVRVLYDELIPDNTTLPEHIDDTFGIDLSKLEAFSFDLGEVFGDGIPSDNTQDWSPREKNSFGKVWARIVQVSTSVDIGMGNYKDDSNTYYDNAGRPKQNIFNAPLDAPPTLDAAIDLTGVVADSVKFNNKKKEKKKTEEELLKYFK